MSGMVIVFFLKPNCFINLNLNMQSVFHANIQFQRIVIFCDGLVLNTVKLEYNTAKLVEVNTGRGLLQ